MTDEPTIPDPFGAAAEYLAKRSVDQVNRIVTAMLVEAVDQVRKSPDTWQHEEVSLSLRDLAEEALAVPHVAPQDVVLATARAAAALTVPLCKALGIDPSTLVRDIEDRTFRSTL